MSREADARVNSLNPEPEKVKDWQREQHSLHSLKGCLEVVCAPREFQHRNHDGHAQEVEAPNRSVIDEPDTVTAPWSLGKSVEVCF